LFHISFAGLRIGLERADLGTAGIGLEGADLGLGLATAGLDYNTACM